MKNSMMFIMLGFLHIMFSNYLSIIGETAHSDFNFILGAMMILGGLALYLVEWKSESLRDKINYQQFKLISVQLDNIDLLLAKIAKVKPKPKAQKTRKK